MTRAGRRRAPALAWLAIASLAAAGAGACRRKAPFAKLPEPAADFPFTVGVDSKDARPGRVDPSPSAAPADAGEKPLLTKQLLPPEVRALIDRAHAHVAVPTLEAAGCDLALVMTGADYQRFVDLRHGANTPAAVADRRQLVVACQRRTPTPPDCAELAAIFVRVAHPKRPFRVLSGDADPPFAARCAGLHDAVGRAISGEGPGYSSSRRR